MELAVHLRENIYEIQDFSIQNSLHACFRYFSNNTLSILNNKISSLGRVYIGDEFCFNRLPNTHYIDNILNFIHKENIGLSFLTPILSDLNLNTLSSNLDYLYKYNPDTEIVINDWGLLFFLKENYPSFNLALGRLLDKGFKDPRLKSLDYDLPDEIYNLLNSSTFDDPSFQYFVSSLGVNRLESDIFPYKDHLISSNLNLNISIYFPFTYITSGRNCLLSLNDANPKEYFVPIYRCSQPCKQFSINLFHNSFAFPVFQYGNTIFFKLNDALLSNLFSLAEQYNLRLVYQGLAYENNGSS